MRNRSWFLLGLAALAAVAILVVAGGATGASSGVAAAKKKAPTFVIVTGAPISVAPGHNATGSASCPDNMTAIAGGAFVDPNISVLDLGLVTIDSYNSAVAFGGSPGDWVVEMHNISPHNETQSYTVQATCTASKTVELPGALSASGTHGSHR
jgi:hypothetical protein